MSLAISPEMPSEDSTRAFPFRARITRASATLFLLLASGCLVQRPLPDRPPATGVHEMRRTAFPDGSLRREMQLLLWSDGRSERDGREREFHPDGTLAGERNFAHDLPTGLWRTWYRDGTPRSEIDFGASGSSTPCRHRFWHPNGRPAAEGTAIAGVREGGWHYWNEDGSPAREGFYRAGKRDGHWVFYRPDGTRQAEGEYALGARVGVWTIWDEAGAPHASSASEVEVPAADPAADQ